LPMRLTRQRQRHLIQIIFSSFYIYTFCAYSKRFSASPVNDHSSSNVTQKESTPSVKVFFVSGSFSMLMCIFCNSSFTLLEVAESVTRLVFIFSLFICNLLDYLQSHVCQQDKLFNACPFIARMNGVLS